MKKAVLKFGFAIVCIVVFLVVSYVALIVYINWPDRPIAKNITVTQEWTEVHLERPLSFNNRSQSLNLKIQDFTLDRGSNIRGIKLPSGMEINPEIEIIDDHGNVVELHHTGFALKYFDAVEFSPSNAVLPDQEYKLIRIRSDVPFHCDGIYWIDYNPK